MRPARYAAAGKIVPNKKPRFLWRCTWLVHRLAQFPRLPAKSFDHSMLISRLDLELELGLEVWKLFCLLSDTELESIFLVKINLELDTLDREFGCWISKRPISIFLTFENWIACFKVRNTVAKRKELRVRWSVSISNSNSNSGICLKIILLALRATRFPIMTLD